MVESGGTKSVINIYMSTKCKSIHYAEWPTSKYCMLYVTELLLLMNYFKHDFNVAAGKSAAMYCLYLILHPNLFVDFILDY